MAGQGCPGPAAARAAVEVHETVPGSGVRDGAHRVALGRERPADRAARETRLRGRPADARRAAEDADVHQGEQYDERRRRYENRRRAQYFLLPRGPRVSLPRVPWVMSRPSISSCLRIGTADAEGRFGRCSLTGRLRLGFFTGAPPC